MCRCCDQVLRCSEFALAEPALPEPFQTVELRTHYDEHTSGCKGRGCDRQWVVHLELSPACRGGLVVTAMLSFQHAYLG